MFRNSIGYGHLGGNISHSVYSGRKADVSRWLGKYFFKPILVFSRKYRTGGSVGH